MNWFKSHQSILSFCISFCVLFNWLWCRYNIAFGVLVLLFDSLFHKVLHDVFLVTHLHAKKRLIAKSHITPQRHARLIAPILALHIFLAHFSLYHHPAHIDVDVLLGWYRLLWLVERTANAKFCPQLSFLNLILTQLGLIQFRLFILALGFWLLFVVTNLKFTRYSDILTTILLHPYEEFQHRNVF